MTGVGGDCFVLVKTATEEAPVALNGSGCVPAGLSLAMARGEEGREVLAETSPLTVTVPGAVDAWWQLHSRFGRLPWRGLFQTAIRYAGAGYPVTPRVAADWRTGQGRVALDEDAREVFLPAGVAPRAGERHRQPALAGTLALIAEEGGRRFYEGRVAEDMVGKLRRCGGPHEVEDFANFSARWERPVCVQFRGWRVWECAPNCQGVVALLMLALLEREPARAWDDLEGLCRFVEVTRRAYTWRDRFLGDVTADWQGFVSRAANEEVNEDWPGAPGAAHRDTVYLSVVDGQGLAVSFINSLFHPFGCGIVAPETGVLFHNRGLSFCLEEGHPNVLAPGRRPMHTIIPAIATNENGDTLVFGVMGGQYQAAGQAWFLSRLFDEGRDLQGALDVPRVFGEGEGVTVEPGFGSSLRRGLAERGYRVAVAREPVGGGQAVLRRADGVFEAASDARKDGFAVAF